MRSDQFSVRVNKYDGNEYRRWNAQLSRREGSLIVLNAEFETAVEHESLGTIPRGTRTVEYYWLDRWYNIFRFLKDDGTTRLWYCNVSMPVTQDDAGLSYIDLDVDVLVQPDFKYEVLDLDDFDKNAQSFDYSELTRRKVQEAVEELRSLIETRQFPFSL